MSEQVERPLQLGGGSSGGMPGSSRPGMAAILETGQPARGAVHVG